MDESENNLLTCEACNNSVKEDDDFCPYCGTLFIDEIFCDDHNEILADGICIIRQIPFCRKCGVKINNRFLCNQHSNYEIYEVKAKVYETVDETDVLYSKNCRNKMDFIQFYYVVIHFMVVLDFHMLLLKA